jgi:rhamnulokinase
MASTTQLLGLDCRWSRDAFDLSGWPVPDEDPEPPGRRAGRSPEGVEWIRVGSHDTASAVCGFGDLAPGEVFLNVGTWSLIGTLLDEPIASDEAERGGWTHERAVDGRIRFLKNIPGFYVINRLHDELGVGVSVPFWLAGADHETTLRVDLLDPSLFSPSSMVEACRAHLPRAPISQREWAGVALHSLTEAVARQPGELERLTGRRFDRIRVGGGGSLSAAFCQALAEASERMVVAGPAEATVAGNLALQLRVSGELEDDPAMARCLARSFAVHRYFPTRP